MPGSRVEEIYYWVKSKIRDKLQLNPAAKNEKYLGVKCYNEKTMNKYIADLIDSGKPFMVTRFGGTELFAMRTAEFNRTSKLDKAIKNMDAWSGFFPAEPKLLYDFNDLMKKDCKEIDILGAWYMNGEAYYAKHYCSSLKGIGILMTLEPWNCMDDPWTAHLKGKKVLVIHPFEKTIRSQYEKHDKLFDNPDLLPEMELLTLKAVQTSGSATDDRFDTWFDALKYMCDECDKIDFDIALIGCGAYGFPLAAHIKRMGKQAIHLGGVLQILFGIKGRRWDESSTSNMYNENWVYPDKSEVPEGAVSVEGACYWAPDSEEENVGEDKSDNKEDGNE